MTAIWGGFAAHSTGKNDQLRPRSIEKSGLDSPTGKNHAKRVGIGLHLRAVRRRHLRRAGRHRPPGLEIDDPHERIFALLNGYRTHLVSTEFTYGCPIGSLALEIHEPDPEVRELLAANFVNWTDAVTRCLEQMGNRLPPDTDRRALAELILTVMEGAIMQARTFHDIGVFDRNVAMLAAHLDALERAARSATATGSESWT